MIENADLATFYDTGPAGFAVAVTHGENTFAGILDTVDADSYSASATHTTHTLRYPSASATLAHNALVTIDGATYKVMGVAHRLTTVERSASLALQS